MDIDDYLLHSKKIKNSPMLPKEYWPSKQQVRDIIDSRKSNVFAAITESLTTELAQKGFNFVEAMMEIKNSTGDTFIDQNMYKTMLKNLKTIDDSTQVYYIEGKTIKKRHCKGLVLTNEIYYRYLSVLVSTINNNTKRILDTNQVKYLLQKQLVGFSIDEDYVYIFCYIWSLFQIQNRKFTNKFFDIVDVNIYVLDSSIDNYYTVLLSCQDTATKFIILRPLRTDAVEDISIELLKIFANYGIPSLINTNNFVKIYTALKLLNTNSLGQKSLLIPTIIFSEPFIQRNTLFSKINTSMSEIDFKDYGLTCQYFQWQYNYVLDTDNYSIPADKISKLKLEAMENDNNRSIPIANKDIVTKTNNITFVFDSTGKEMSDDCKPSNSKAGLEEKESNCIEIVDSSDSDSEVEQIIP